MRCNKLGSSIPKSPHQNAPSKKGGVSETSTYLHDIFIDLLGVPVDQVDFFGVSVLKDLLLVGVILICHGWSLGPCVGWNGAGVDW